jgi:hypothetical protein
LGVWLAPTVNGRRRRRKFGVGLLGQFARVVEWVERIESGGERLHLRPEEPPRLVVEGCEEMTLGGAQAGVQGHQKFDALRSRQTHVRVPDGVVVIQESLMRSELPGLTVTDRSGADRGGVHLIRK